MPQRHIQLLLKYHLQDSEQFSNNEAMEILQTGIFISANKEPCEQHNNAMLYRNHAKTNPVAIIRAHTTSTQQNIRGCNKHYDGARHPPITCFAIGSTIQITGYNAQPKWGLYHGSIGTVIDIVFYHGQNPNLGHQPKYVLCDFPQYTGPPFLQQHPTYVPISPIEVPCKILTCSY